MKKITIHTKTKKEVIDITDKISSVLPKISGTCNIFCSHTTAAISTADLDPGTDQDMLDAFAHIVPKLNYRHPHNPEHVGDHILSTIIGASITIPIKEGKLLLGTWQRIVLFEFDGPRERNLFVVIQKEDF